MALELTENTRSFQKGVKTLIDKGLAKNQSEIIKAIGWNKPTMSAVMNGAMNVPDHIFIKFKNVYKDVVGNNGDDYKDKYLALLEKQLHERENQINARFAAYDVFIEKMYAFIEDQKEYQQKILANFAIFEQLTMVNRSYLKINYLTQQEILAMLEKKPLTVIQQRKDKQLAELMTGAS